MPWVKEQTEIIIESKAMAYPESCSILRLQMITRPIDYAGVNENLKKRILLVFTGYLTPALAELIEETNAWSKKHDEPIVEVWDIEILATEFYEHLLKIDLVGSVVGADYYNDVNKMALQISSSSYPTGQIVEFVDKYYSIEFNRISRSNMIKMVLIYVLKKAQTEDNIYAFFYFAEYLMIKLWHNMPN